MAKPRREMSPRRVAKSVRNQEKTMEAYGRAANWASSNQITGTQPNKGTFQTTRVAVNSKTRQIFTPGAGHVAEKMGEAITVDGERGIEKRHYVPEARTDN
jgi:hypothetical protein